MKKTSVLKIAVFEKVKVLDIFVTAKQWLIEQLNSFTEKAIAIFYSNTYVNWRGIPVRGPNVGSNSNSFMNYVFLA